MNPFKFVKRRPVTTLLLLVALIGGGIYGLYKKRIDVPALHTSQLYSQLDYMAPHVTKMRERVESYFHKADEEEAHEEPHKVVATSPKVMDVIITRPYVCQMHSQQHIDVCALTGGYLANILVKEGQTVKEGDLIFKINPVLYQAKFDAETARADLAQLKFEYTKKLFATKVQDQSVVSESDVKLHGVELAEAKAKAKQAGAELDFTNIKANFDGIVDRLFEQKGSLIKEGDLLTTLSDNRVMWVYFKKKAADR